VTLASNRQRRFVSGTSGVAAMRARRARWGVDVGVGVVGGVGHGRLSSRCSGMAP
jgi:hypothetical protein